MWHGIASRRFLTISFQGNSTTTLGHLFQSADILIVKFFLMIRCCFRASSSARCPPSPLHCPYNRASAPSSWHTPFRYLQIFIHVNEVLSQPCLLEVYSPCSQRGAPALLGHAGDPLPTPYANSFGKASTSDLNFAGPAHTRCPQLRARLLPHAGPADLPEGGGGGRGETTPPRPGTSPSGRAAPAAPCRLQHGAAVRLMAGAGRPHGGGGGQAEPGGAPRPLQPPPSGSGGSWSGGGLCLAPVFFSAFPLPLSCSAAVG